MTHATRRGMILPLVLVTMLLAITLAAATQMVAWRAARGARTQWDAHRALYAADAALVSALAQWNADSVAQLPVGTARQILAPAPSGISLYVMWVRTSMLRGQLLAVAEQGSRDPFASVRRIRRTATRAIALAPPPLPVLAAATFLGDVRLRDTLVIGGVNVPELQYGGFVNAGAFETTFDGRDQLGPAVANRDDCGVLRDTASIPALAVSAAVHAPAVRADFDRAWTLLSNRVTAQLRTRSNASSGIVTNWTGGDAWTSVVMEGAPNVTMTGASAHVGLLAINGDLAIQGSLTVIGALVVRGALHVESGELHVQGALVVADRDGIGSRINGRTTIRYAPCLLGRAHISVSVPRTAPFHLWNSP